MAPDRRQVVLTREEARRFYDRIGLRQDSQGFYEDEPLRVMTAAAGFPSSRTVAEFGCGTGRFALGLLREQLPADSIYLGLELSPVMADLARRRLEPFADRVAIVLTDGSPSIPVRDGCLDRVVSNYVLDLLGETDIRAILEDAWRALRPEGRICLTGLTWGARGVSKALSRAWNGLQSLKPAWVGGCRPIDLRPFFEPGVWEVLHCQTVVSSWIPSQTLVARPLR